MTNHDSVFEASTNENSVFILFQAYDGVKSYRPAHCEHYYSADLTKTLRINVDKALSQLQGGVDAAIVSEDENLLFQLHALQAWQVSENSDVNSIF